MMMLSAKVEERSFMSREEIEECLRDQLAHLFLGTLQNLIVTKDFDSNGRMVYEAKIKVDIAYIGKEEKK